MKELALLGFLPDVEKQLKGLIEEKIDQPVNWLSATDSKVEGVVINADFLGTPEIQKYVRRIDASVVCSYNSSDRLELAKHFHIPALQLGEQDPKQINQWLQALMTNKRTPSSEVDINSLDQGALPQSMAAKPAPSPEHTAEANTSPIETDAPTHTDPLSLFDALQHPNQFIEITTKDNITWVDTAKKKAYFNYDRKEIPGIHKTTWRCISDRPTADIVHYLPLSLWLFEAIWQSNINDGLNGTILENGTYKITRWPRPLSDNRNSEALRLAAFLRDTPSNVKTLAQRTGYDEHLVYRFFCATLLSNQLTLESVDETSTPSRAPSKSLQAYSPTPSTANAQEKKQKLSLLSRFRRKLGLN